MINKWILNNFKSIDREKDLEFRPLTIFTGANSSGKSTILQSILLVAQTLQNKTATRSVVLNGWFKKFGSYSDIVYGRKINKNIKIGFSISEDDYDNDDFFLMRGRARLRQIPPMVPWNELEETECQFVLSSAGKEDNLQPELESSRIETIVDGKTMEYMETSKIAKRSEVEQVVYEVAQNRYSIKDLQYTLKSSNLSRRMYDMDDEIPWKPIGVKHNHFMPEVMIGYCTKAERAKMQLRRFLLTGDTYYFYDIKEFEKMVVPFIEEKAMDIVEQLYKRDLVRLKNSEKKYEEIHFHFTLRRFQYILRGCALDEDEKLKFITQIVDKLNALPVEYQVEPQHVYRFSGIETIKDFFQTKINYLGPLREEPRSLYPLSNDGSTTEVGLKGENTAAVYENNKKALITYVSPSSFGTQEIVIKEKKGSLAEAINEWLRYMGVASDVATDDRGKIGHSMQISNDLNIKQDLTHVGVGVSQVLPILVMSLLAKKGDVIILEQPELHLHPRVQTRLADFFVSMNALGKQCIIETHSEYLINRLRFFVAISDDMTIAKDTMIYFVGKEDGHSVYQPVTINEYGVIEEWPDGFFDEAQKMSAAILEKGMKKRMRELNIEEDED